MRSELHEPRAPRLHLSFRVFDESDAWTFPVRDVSSSLGRPDMRRLGSVP
jgi:hypothetical protein